MCNSSTIWIQPIQMSHASYGTYSRIIYDKLNKKTDECVNSNGLWNVECGLNIVACSLNEDLFPSFHLSTIQMMKTSKQWSLCLAIGYICQLFIYTIEINIQNVDAKAYKWLTLSIFAIASNYVWNWPSQKEKKTSNDFTWHGSIRSSHFSFIIYHFICRSVFFRSFIRLFVCFLFKLAASILKCSAPDYLHSIDTIQRNNLSVRYWRMVSSREYIFGRLHQSWTKQKK